MAVGVLDGGSGRYCVFWLMLLLARSADSSIPEKDATTSTETGTAAVLKERVVSALTIGTARPLQRNRAV